MLPQLICDDKAFAGLALHEYSLEINLIRTCDDLLQLFSCQLLIAIVLLCRSCWMRLKYFLQESVSILSLSHFLLLEDSFSILVHRLVVSDWLLNIERVDLCRQTDLRTLDPHQVDAQRPSLIHDTSQGSSTFTISILSSQLVKSSVCFSILALLLQEIIENSFILLYF